MLKAAAITLERDTYTSKTTIGKLYLNGLYICDTLEDVCRDLNRDGDLNDVGEKKIYGETAIPAGTYPVKVTLSPHFKVFTPRLFNIEGYSYVLIHKGNVPADTKGCILVGQRGIDCLKGGTSSLSFNKLMFALKDFEVIEIQVKDKV